MSKIFLYLFFIQLFIFSNTFITFPFTRIHKDEESPENFYDINFDNIIYTKSDIGTPNTEVSLQIKFGQYSLCLRNDTIYDYLQSSSFVPNDTKEIAIYDRDFRKFRGAKETFQLGNQKTKIDNLNFMLTHESKYTSDGLLGLKLLDNNEKVKGYNLIAQLKDKKLINKRAFFLTFDQNSDNGELIIGDYPHLIEKYKNTYHEEQFRTKTIFIRNYEETYNLQFGSIYWNGKEINKFTTATLEIESGMIKGSMKFCDDSWDFFRPHFLKKKCERVDVKVLYETYICDDYEDLDIKQFPPIKFNINEEDYSLELTYNDVFKKKDGKIYFMIYFAKNGYDVTWTLGHSFLKRNFLVFDVDKKVVGFYKKDIKEPQKEKNIPLIVAIVVASLVIVGLVGFILYKYVFQKRKKKPYELEEGFDEDSKNAKLDSKLTD